MLTVSVLRLSSGAPLCCRCGPCRLIYPLLKEKKAELAGRVTFYKFDCSKKNKDLGVKLGIKVAPTVRTRSSFSLTSSIPLQP